MPRFRTGLPGATRPPETVPRPTHRAALAIPGERTGVARAQCSSSLLLLVVTGTHQKEKLETATVGSGTRPRALNRVIG